ncbi:MAG: protein kinase domain-containing protein [Hyphomicrobium sp.]
MQRQDSPALPNGTRIDHYVITGQLGQGGFGITYLAHDELLQKDFALKEYFPEELVRREGQSVRFSAKPNSEADYRWGLKKFFDEARMLAQFAHPSIINVRRVFEANDTAYMVLDLIKGLTLERWLQGLDTPPTQDELDLITAPLLNALEFVHTNRTWHLDFSPENVMIRSTDGIPILLDFGASRLEIKQRSQLVSALVFKSGYSAPEQYTSNADRYGAWTDIYAFGATLYRAVSGTRPTEATSRQLSEDLVPVARAARGRYRDKFLKAIDHAMRLPPAERPQSIAVWRRALLDGSTVAPMGQVNSRANRTTLMVQTQSRAVDPGGLQSGLSGATGAGSWQAGTPTGSSRSDTQRAVWPRSALRALAALCLVAAGGLIAALALPGQTEGPLGSLRVKATGAMNAITGRGSPCAGFFTGATCWGAVAEKEGKIFVRVEAASRSDAESAALQNCADRAGRDGCSVIAVLSKDECWANAVAPANSTQKFRWKGATGATLEAARSNAKWDCERSFGYCQTAVAYCANGAH